jgi:CRISPR-associated protein Csy1
MSGEALNALEARLSAGDAAGARTAASALLADATLPAAERVAALRLRARAHEALRDLRAAIADLEGAVALAPRDARACNELGILCADAGDRERALAAFRQATAVDPSFVRAWNNLGCALRDGGRSDLAADAFAKAVAVDPGRALAWANLGAVRRDLGDDAGADAALGRALALDPASYVANYTLAGLRREESRLDEAARLYEEAARLAPRDANAPFLLAGTLAERDDVVAARAAYDAALARDPAMLRAALGRRLTLPMVPGSAAAIAEARLEYADGLAALERELPQRAASLSADRAVDALRWSNFLLAYHGEDDTELQRRYGRLLAGVLAARAPEFLRPPPPRAPDGRLRVGFASALLRDGTVGRYFERWIADLPRADFEVCVYHTLPTVDALAGRLRARADRFRHCPRWRPSQLARQVRSDQPDVLVYPELGMDATMFALASLRLARRQCAAWGHPVTTGLPTIDAYFTCAAMEPPDADGHYSERLLRLPGIGTRYAMPSMPDGAARSRFGLPADAPLFLCPQSLFKIHPDDEALFARVLAAVPAARLVLFEGRDPALTAKFLARVAAAGVDTAARTHVLPQCAHDEYLRINACCDAMLDTTRWSGGNTALDALACALPVVTLPGRFMRARQTMAILELAGVPELIARDGGDYVRIATRLATDRAWRDAVSARLAQGRARVFDDPAPVAALARALADLAR